MSKDLTDVAGVLEQINEIDDMIQQLNDRRDLLKADIIAALDGEDEGTIDGRAVISYKTHTQNRFDQTLFKESMPDMYARFLKASTVTRFVVIKDKEPQL